MTESAQGRTKQELKELRAKAATIAHHHFMLGERHAEKGARHCDCDMALAYQELLEEIEKPETAQPIPAPAKCPTCESSQRGGFDSWQTGGCTKELHDSWHDNVAPAPEERTPHDCERELDKAKATNAAPDDFKAQDGTLWQCSCGKVYVHTCDEAEGCEWTETEDHTEASSPSGEPSANFVSEVRPDAPCPSCHVCGALTVATAWKCLSCGSTTEPVASGEPAPTWCCDGKQYPGEDRHNDTCQYSEKNFKLNNPPPASGPSVEQSLRERLSAKEWLNMPENDIGFEPHRFDSNGPICGNGIVMPGCERCAVEIALEAYHVYRQAGAASRGETDAKFLRDRIFAMMEKRQWSCHWIHRSAYLHLESAELAEAVRGKRGDTLDESADVLITMLALSPHDLPEIIDAATSKVASLMTKPKYAGETGIFGDVFPAAPKEDL